MAHVALNTGGGSERAYIGYNVSKANELMNRIAEAYKNMGIYTQQQWEPVYKTLQAHWIGEDEQDYEARLADRICTLYNNAYNLAQSSLDTIEGLAYAWHDFQQKNTLTGDTAKNSLFSSFKVEKPVISRPKEDDPIVKPHLIYLTDEDNRGLRYATSKREIESAVDNFVAQIKAQTNNLFDEIQTDQAFFGEQASSIKNYITKTGDAIAEVTIAVKDMYNALDQLMTQNYSSSDANIQSSIQEANTQIDQSLNDLGSSRWS